VNVLSREKRIALLHALVEGNSERACERMCDIDRKTVSRLALEFGLGAQRLHDKMARNLMCAEVIGDEMWSYVFVKEARVRPDHPEGSGEAYIFSALDKASRFVITWHVGKRDQASTNIFAADLRTRLAVMPSITTDGFAAYPQAIGQSFGPSVDFAQTVKNYRGGGRRDDHRYEPARGIDFITKKVVFGAPELNDASTALIERNNGTMRHKIGRIRRLVYAFSKRLPNHKAACATAYVWYNVGCILRTLRVTPAMAIGATDHLWDIAEFHDAVTEAAKVPQAKPEKQPLAHRTPVEPARALPAGRGFLRLLEGGNAPKAPTPAPSPAAPAKAAPVAPPVREVSRKGEQLDMFEEFLRRQEKGPPAGGKDE
jgi:IS1 family transposase